MNSPTGRCVRGLIDAHFFGSISPRRERVLRAHLPACPSCRAYYERHLLLARLDPSAKSAEERIASGLGLPRARRTAPAWSLAVAFCAIFAAAVVLPPRLPSQRAPAGFLPRGATPAGAPSLLVYRVDPTARLEQGSTIHPNDDLAFAYVNPSAFGRLLVYGVDEHSHVFWYYPAWSNPADDPHAVPLAAGPEVRELPEAIRHELDGHELTIHALFLRDDDDLTVRHVERLLSERPTRVDAPWTRGAQEQQLVLRVEP